MVSFVTVRLLFKLTVFNYSLEMHLQPLILSSSLLLAPLLNVVNAYPRPIAPGAPVLTTPHNIVNSGNRQGSGRNGQGGRKKDPKDGSEGRETTADFTGSDGTSSGEPESDIFHAPDGGDDTSTCSNPLPETLLFSVEKGHDCIKMANIYNDRNTYAEFNCEPATRQKKALCREAPNFGALAGNCYEFLKQNHPNKAEDILDYVGLCRR